MRFYACNKYSVYSLGCLLLDFMNGHGITHHVTFKIFSTSFYKTPTRTFSPCRKKLRSKLILNLSILKHIYRSNYTRRMPALASCAGDDKPVSLVRYLFLYSFCLFGQRSRHYKFVPIEVTVCCSAPLPSDQSGSMLFMLRWS